MSITISVYNLWECIQNNPYPAVFFFVLFFPVFCLVWKIAFWILNANSQPDGFIGVWLLSARFLLFWTGFYYASYYCLDTVVYATTAPAVTTITEENADCLQNASYRMVDGAPAMLWFDNLRITLCMANLQGKKRLGDAWEPKNLSILEYLDEFFEKATARHLSSDNSDAPVSP